METTALWISSVPSPTPSLGSPFNRDLKFQLRGRKPISKLSAISSHDGSSSNRARLNSVADVHKKSSSSLESRFCYDKPIPEEIIEKPIGLSLAEKSIGDNPRCLDCQAIGAILCSTCSGSGLYIDSILESQGIIVKVRCLGCGGTGNIMCSECGGRGHLGAK
ncbi:uncharacterized protein LOC122648476 [Telopea speciosissima]|uniref:uncharacterized protein LOC122648476 n=1 Tax=Telopea speciosissima TaxID=54955 RepID=UPI001CC79C6D|nr:uncharacterized protein LOC122648476 [Telopea speciosissima]